MKCNIPKTKERDKQRLREELCKLRCSKCGTVIREYSSPFFMVYQYQKENARLCTKCKGEKTNERADY